MKRLDCNALSIAVGGSHMITQFDDDDHVAIVLAADLDMLISDLAAVFATLCPVVKKIPGTGKQAKKLPPDMLASAWTNTGGGQIARLASDGQTLCYVLAGERTIYWHALGMKTQRRAETVEIAKAACDVVLRHGGLVLGGGK